MHAEVLAVAVDAEHLAERARVDELLQLLHAGVVEEQVAGHEHEVALLGERDELVDLGRGHRGRLLDEHVLAGLERGLRELVVGRDRRRDDDGVELRVGEHLLEVVGPARLRIARRGTPSCLPVRRIAEPGELGEVGEVPREVLPPLAQARLADADASQLPDLVGAPPVRARRVAEVDDEHGLVDERARSRSRSGS